MNAEERFSRHLIFYSIHNSIRKIGGVDNTSRARIPDAIKILSGAERSLESMLDDTKPFFISDDLRLILEAMGAQPDRMLRDDAKAYAEKIRKYCEALQALDLPESEDNTLAGTRLGKLYDSFMRVMERLSDLYTDNYQVLD